MRIQTIISRHRRDFTADYVCQHCAHVVRDSGYDDAYFHATVIPAAVCPNCGKTGNEQTSTAAIPAGVVL